MTSVRFDEEKTSSSQALFDSIRVGFGGVDISILTDIAAIETGVQQQFVEILQRRRIDENWDFLVAAKSLFSQREAGMDTTSFRKGLRALSDLYFKKGSAKQLNLESSDLDRLVALVESDKVHSPYDLFINVQQKVTEKNNQNAVYEVFSVAIKNNLVLDKAKLDAIDLTEYLALKFKKARLQLVICDALNAITQSLEVLNAKKLPAIKSTFKLTPLERVARKIKNMIERLKKFHAQLSQLLQESDRMIFSEFEEKFVALAKQYLALEDKKMEKLQSLKDKVGPNLVSAIKDAESMLEALKLQLRIDHVLSERVNIVMAKGPQEMKGLVQASTEGVLWTANALHDGVDFEQKPIRSVSMLKVV